MKRLMFPLIAFFLLLTACNPVGTGSSDFSSESAALTESESHTCTGDIDDNLTDAKPVIYLYPETETTVHVEVAYQGKLTVTIPPYQNGWTVIAAPDGTLTDKDGWIYPYLFWEGTTKVLLPMDEGFCIKGEDTKDFLLDALPRLGLIESEYTEFIDFWLPRMEGNPYNIITFQTDAYEALAPLAISPTPDAILRVFMTFRASETPVALPEQEIKSFTRHGFTVIEWGGREQ